MSAGAVPHVGGPDAVWLHRGVVEPTGDGVLRDRTFGVKDNVDVAGMPTTAACPAFRFHPERSATVVARLLGAGARCVGKTNMDQFATGLVGVRSPHGTPPNPLDPDLVPGGSSSGSAVAVARGDVDIALGTDTAGSGRVPAALCGIVGFKPAPGEWPADGVVPACRTLDTVSVFTTSVADALVVDAVVRCAPPRRPAVGPVRVGVAGLASMEPCDDDVRSGVDATLADLGPHGVAEVDLRVLFDVGDLLYDGPWIAERTAAVGDFLRAHRDEVHPVVAEIILGGAQWSAVDAFRARYRLDGLADAVGALFDEVDVLLLPTVPTRPTRVAVAADPVGLNRRLGRYTNFVNLLGLAALAVPGAPGLRGAAVGVSVIAPPDRWPEIVAVAATVAGEDLGAPLSGMGVGARSPGVPRPAGVGDAPEPADGGRVELAVVGAHLSGLPLNDRLTARGAVLAAQTTTAPAYRLWRLPGDEPARPALERMGDGGAAVACEVWSLDVAGFGAVVAEVTPPLAVGSVELADGRWVRGFVGEAGGLAGAVDISASGGWRAHLARPAVRIVTNSGSGRHSAEDPDP